MSKLTVISSKDMVKILEKLGFEEVRQKGSHKSFRHKDGRTTLVPFHGEDLGRGLRGTRAGDKGTGSSSQKGSKRGTRNLSPCPCPLSLMSPCP